MGECKKDIINMNILSLIDFFNPECLGGAARVFYETNRVLAQKGHFVEAICRGQGAEGMEHGRGGAEHRTSNIEHSTSNEENPDNPFSTSDLGPRTTDHGKQVIFHSYPDIEGNQFKKIKYYGRSIKKLFNEYLSENKPDLIILHSSSAAFGLYDELRKTDIPIIYYFHSPWNREYEIIADKKCCGIQCPVVSILSAVRKRHERKYLKLASGIITLSKSMQDILLEVHPAAKNVPLLIDPGAANEEVYSPAANEDARKNIRKEFGLNEDAFCIITSRRLVPRTGVDVLIKAFAEVKRKHRAESIEHGEEKERISNIEQEIMNSEGKSRSIKLILTGGGISADFLKQLAVELGVGEDVIFTGHVSEEDLAKYYRCSDLFVMPTKFLEGFGLSTVEAMASGLPVIGTDIGGTPEILRKISDELIIPECSVESIFAKIAEFINKDDLEIWREKSVRCFKENFTWERHVDSLLEFAENLN